MSRLMEKLATRAWKKNIDVIDRHPEYRKRLEDAGVIDYKREVDGLEKGSDAIVKRYGLQVERLKPTKRIPEPEGRRAAKLIKDFRSNRAFISSPDSEYDGSTASSAVSRFFEDRRARLQKKQEYEQKFNQRARAGFGFITDPNTGVIFRGDFAREPHEDIVQAAKTNNQARAILRQYAAAKENEIYRNAANALAFRHEVDEGRTNDEQRKTPGTENVPHRSARVIERESINLAGMPIQLRRHMRELRAPEGAIMQKVKPDFQYGKSGKDKHLFK